jgi:hypothetical protein
MEHLKSSKKANGMNHQNRAQQNGNNSDRCPAQQQKNNNLGNLPQQNQWKVAALYWKNTTK